MQKERWRRWIIPILLIGGTILWLRFALRPRSQLVASSTPLVGAQDWRQEYSGYFWKSNNELLFSRDAGAGGLRIFVRNIATQQESPLPALDRLLAGQNPNMAYWRLSPDGQWLLAATLNRRQKPTFNAYALDGSRKVTWPVVMGSEMEILWLPDSRRWVEFRATLRGIRTRLHTLDGKDTNGPALNGPCAWPLGVTPNGSVINLEQMSPRPTLMLYPLHGSISSSQNATVPLPASARIVEAEPSPDGGHMAYLTASSLKAPLKSLLQSLFPSLDRTPHPRQTLWIARADGSGLREVGVEDTARIAGLQWTPDGKRLSFFADDILRLLPITP